jgi:hypothetical protein
MKFIDQQNCWRAGRKWILIAEVSAETEIPFRTADKGSKKHQAAMQFCNSPEQ